MSARYLELMEQKNAVVERVLELTRKQVFTGAADAAESEAEAFSELYERREIVLRSIPKIEASLKHESEVMGLPPGGHLVSEKYRAQLEEIISRQKGMATELIELDEANFKVYEKLKSQIMGDLKNVRQSKNLNERYLDDTYDTQGYYFDKKN
ncbi:MAG: hypothetical protein FWB74_01400 [Defluviitaleaceae bacterium]|nr:hypothetical protein [Defluviitaleaceae bacterium]